MPPNLGARVAARVVDGLLVAVVAGVAATVLDVDQRWIAAPVSLVYETVAVARWGATLGKRKFAIEVVGEGGGRVNAGGALVRAAVLLLPLHLLPDRIDTVAEWGLVLVIVANGWVVATRRVDRRGLHDLAAGTRPVAVAA